MTDAALLARFWSKVDVRGLDDCWLWLASYAGPLKGRYGQFYLARKVRKAHVVAYELVIGLVPRGLELDHLCRVKGCCNPWHLEPVTRTENVRRSAACKLTPEEVRQIREHPGTITEAAALVGIGYTQARYIRRRLSWADLPDRPIARTL